MPDFLGMMKQAAQLQSKMQAMQEELGNLEVEGISGGGLVAVRMTAKMEVKGIKIDASLMKAEEREVLEDLLVTAHNDARRKAELARMAKMAGSADSDGGTAAGKGKGGGNTGGQDERDAGPSAGYAGRIRAAVRPNIVFTDDVPGNPRTVVEVRTGPTGTIISARVVKSSGVKSWDDAVLRALDRTEKLPSDGGRYYNPLEIAFNRRD